MSNAISGVNQPPPRPAPEAAAPARAAASVLEAVPTAEAKSLSPAQAERTANPEAVLRELKQATERLNEQARKDGRKLNFSMDSQSDRVVITVRKEVTGEVIRQIPSEAVLRVAHNMEQLKGLLHDQST